MSIEVRFTFRDLAEMQAFMADRTQQTIAQAPVDNEKVPAPEQTEKPKTRKTRTTKKTEPEQAEQPKADDAKPDPEADSKQPSLDDTREAAMRLKDAKGMPAVVAVLKQFDASKVSEVAEDKRAEFIAACSKEVA